MSKAGLKVQCLASTRVSGPAWLEERQELLERDEDDLNKELDDHERGAQLEENEETESRTEIDDVQEEDRSSGNHGGTHTSCIQEAQLSPDGTCIFTSDFNRSFSVYPMDASPAPDNTPRPLKPYARLTSPDPIWSFAANPFFDINDASSTHVLISRRDRYITLHNALWATPQPDAHPTQPINISTPLTCYKLTNPLTEAITAPLSLAYSHTATHFFAGHHNAISTFDLTSPSAPIHTIRTIPSARTTLKGGGRGFKGWLSALTLSPPSPFAPAGLLTAGSRTRNIGIYDPSSAREITTFSLPGGMPGGLPRPAALQRAIGAGVAHIKYSPCGTYLYVAERQSDALLIYDVRRFGLALGYCVGRNAVTKGALGFDVWGAGAGSGLFGSEARSHEVWAGGVDGVVRVWRDPYRGEGPVEPDERLVVGDGGVPVVGTMVHPSGKLAVAACGKVDVGSGEGSVGRRGGGGTRPAYTEYGSLDILGLD